MWAAQLESDGQEHQDLLHKRACRGPRSTQTHPPTRHALHPHLGAPPRPSATSGLRFRPAPGCRQARIAQPSHLTHNSRIRRARGPGAARRPSHRDRGRLWTPTTHPMRHASAQGPCRLRRALQLAVGPLLGHPALDLGRESAAEIRYLARIAAADFVHLHDSNAELNSIGDYNGAMGGGPGGSAALVRASPAAIQQQKPKTVSRGWAGPAGRRGRRGEPTGAHLNRHGSR